MTIFVLQLSVSGSFFNNLVIHAANLSLLASNAKNHNAQGVKHPSEYKLSGYNEIQTPPERYIIIDSRASLYYFSMSYENMFQQTQRSWVEEEMKNDQLQRNHLWTEAIAIGNNGFVEDVNRQIKDKCNMVLKEPSATYSILFIVKGALSYENICYVDTIA